VTNKYKLRLPAVFVSAFVISVSKGIHYCNCNHIMYPYILYISVSSHCY